MTAKAVADIAAVQGAYDFAPFGTIADMGGGRGHLLRAILDAVPSPKACCSTFLTSSTPSTSSTSG